MILKSLSTAGNNKIHPPKFLNSAGYTFILVSLQGHAYAQLLACTCTEQTSWHVKDEVRRWISDFLVFVLQQHEQTPPQWNCREQTCHSTHTRTDRYSYTRSSATSSLSHQSKLQAVTLLRLTQWQTRAGQQGGRTFDQHLCGRQLDLRWSLLAAARAHQRPPLNETSHCTQTLDGRLIRKIQFSYIWMRKFNPLLTDVFATWAQIQIQLHQRTK